MSQKLIAERPFTPGKGGSSRLTCMSRVIGSGRLFQDDTSNPQRGAETHHE
jgi:hypothetical protein